MWIFQKYFDENRDCSASCGQICSKTFPGGLWYVPIRMVWARGPGKFCSLRTNEVSVLRMCPTLRKVALPWWFLHFFHFTFFHWPGATQMNSNSFRSPWVKLRQMLHMVRWHQACHWASRISSCRHPNLGVLWFAAVPEVDATTWLVETEILLLSKSNTL